MMTKHFVRLENALRTLETDPATAKDPIKRTFLCDGQYVTANVSILEDTGDAIHIQSFHEELVLILEGEWASESGRKRSGSRLATSFSFPATRCTVRSLITGA